jgi:hypothetical protein
MAVHAHPDDESSKGAATMAKYVAEGVEVLVVSCTDGERGDVLNPALKNDPEILPRKYSVSSTPGWVLWTPAFPRATRCRHCLRAVSPSSPSR